MKHTTGTLIGQRSLRLAYASYEPEHQPKALIILVHGIGEHSGRYKHVIEAFVQRNYAVYMHDHRGHGASQGVRGHIERFDYFVDDLHALVELAREQHSGLPAFMVAHSLGGLIAVHYALRYQAILEGLVLSGPAIQVGDDVSPVIKKLSAVLAAVLPRLRIVPITKSDNPLSRDPVVAELVRADPLMDKGKVRARMGYEIMRSALNAVNRVGELTLPILIMQGDADRIVNPQGALHLYERVSSADKTLKLWPECRHEIFNELEKEEIIAFAADWLDAHAPRNLPESVELRSA